MHAPHLAKNPKGKLATLLGATCLAFVAIPAVAQATIYKTYFPSEGSLQIDGDATSQPIVLGCSGGDQTVNGQFFYRSSVSRNLRCNEIAAIYIDGKEGNDTINTAAVSPAGGYTDIFGSFDFPRAPAHEVYLTGNEGADTLTGGPLGEHFNDTNSSGERGPDTIRAGGGNDGIWGTDEADLIFADAGEDVIYPQLGADIVHGGPAHDVVEDVPFGKSAERIFGDGGADQLFAGGGPDFVDGGLGSDYMDGQSGRDRMFGRAGADGIFGGGGGDFLFGNAGKDYIRGEAGRDKVRGGPGKDDVAQ